MLATVTCHLQFFYTVKTKMRIVDGEQDLGFRSNLSKKEILGKCSRNS